MAQSFEQTSTDIANLALGHAGVSKPIANLSNEKSLEAQMCRTYFDISRQDVLREFGWMFAVKQVAPALITTNPTPEWLYAYQYPADALRLVRFMSYRLSNDTRQSRVPYAIMQPVANTLSQSSPIPPPYPQTTGLWIYTNWPGTNVALPTIIEYIFDNMNVSQWTPDFVLAMSYKLATYIIPSVTSGDPYKYQDAVRQLYMDSISKAKAFNLNEEQRPEEPQSEFIRARDGEYFGFPGMSWIVEPAGFSVQ